MKLDSICLSLLLKELLESVLNLSCEELVLVWKEKAAKISVVDSSPFWFLYCFRKIVFS